MDLILSALLRFSTTHVRLWLDLKTCAEREIPFDPQVLFDFGISKADFKQAWADLVALGLVATNGTVAAVVLEPTREQIPYFGKLAYLPKGQPVPPVAFTHFERFPWPTRLGARRVVAYAPDVEADVAALHAYANATLGYDRKLSATRRTKLVQRLREFSLDELKQVVDYVASDPFLRGKNERARAYDDYSTIFRSRERVEQYLEAARKSSKLAGRALAPSDRPPEFHVM